MNSKVSVIIPVYNVEKYFRECIDSILAQTFPWFECVLVDDSSEDSSPAMCEEYARKDDRVSVVHNEKNLGPSITRKIGLEKSSGEYIMFVDADDYIEADMLERMYSVAASQKYDMVYCDCHYHDEFSSDIYIKTQISPRDFTANVKNIIFGSTGSTVWGKLIKRTIYDKVEFPTDSFAEDRYITVQTLFFSRTIERVGSPLYHYRYNGDSLCNSPEKREERYIGHKNNFDKTCEFLRRHGEDLNKYKSEMDAWVEMIEKKL